LHDVILRNATVCDGTGVDARPGDVAIAGGRIAAIERPGVLGRSAAAGGREIDATGLVAAPGFVDVHTHYDCQLFWDPTASPSSWHGVTSVVMGNCGFTIAPCRPSDRETLMSLLLYVEGMPLETLREGIPWEWEGFPGYLDALDRRGVGPNVAAFVGLSAVRFAAMGGAAVERAARPDEIARMQDLVREALRAGAIGWSTSLSPTHFFGDGTPAPTRFSSEEEMLALAEVSRDEGGRPIELAPKSLLGGPDEKLAELDLFERLARISGGLVSFAPLHDNPFFPGSARTILDAARAIQARGARVVPQVGCRPLELRFDFLGPCFGLENNSFWRPLLHETAGRRREIFAAESFRAKLRETSSGWKALITPSWEKMFLRVPVERHRRFADASVAAIARDLGRDPVDAFLDTVLEGDLGDQWGVEVLNSDEDAVGELVASDGALLALSDAGAHVDTLCDQGYTTYLLGHWVRERGAMRLEDAVRMLSARPAEAYGLHDRGVLAPGRAADVVVFDPRTVRQRPTEVVSDLPGGQRRLLQRAEGIPWVFVNGEAVVEEGLPTGRRAGRVLRAGRA
jgi:N-acyl-D-aspartate/D-glutamate deacylase